jgi:hypothetical protein
MFADVIVEGLLGLSLLESRLIEKSFNACVLASRSGLLVPEGVNGADRFSDFSA